jgi:flagellar motor component MotA
MKKLIGILLVLVIGMVLGYVFHDPIDAKLKAKFGTERVEKAKEATKKGIENAGEATKEATKAGVKKFGEVVDSVKK